MDAKQYCFFTFSIIESISKHNQIIDFPATWKDYQCGVFVTWKTADSKLRGCAGTFDNDNISILLPRYSLMSAFKDKRFSEIEDKELPTLTCTVCVLTQHEECKQWDDWEIGKHGITIKFNIGSNQYSASFLPEIAVEKKFDKKATIVTLMQKAGSFISMDQALKTMKVIKFISTQATITYNEYLDMKKTMSIPMHQAVDEYEYEYEEGSEEDEEEKS